MEVFCSENGVTFKKYDISKSAKTSLKTLKEIIQEETDLPNREELLKKAGEMEELLNQFDTGEGI